MASSANAPDLPWPLEAGRPGLEVWYSLVGPRDGSFAFWYRYTLLSTTGAHREARLWAALTDRAHPERSFLVTRRYTLGSAWIDQEPFRLAFADDVALTDRGAQGRIDSPLGEVRWDLAYAKDPVTFNSIASPLLTRLALFGAKAGRQRSPNGAVLVSGEVAIGSRRLRLEGAPGHQGHTTSFKVGEWTWIQCGAFEDETVAVEVLHTRGLTSLAFRQGGRVHFLNRVRHLVGRRRTRAESGPGRLRVVAEDAGLRLECEVEAGDPALWQRAAYLSPDGTLRYNAHQSLARVRLRYEVLGPGGEWTPARSLTSEAGRAEWVSKRPPLPGRYLPDAWETQTSGGVHEVA